MLAECTLVLLLLYTLWWHLVGKRKEYPPGPTPLPFLGNVLGVNFRYPERSFAKWSREHGPVFTFWLGPMPMVVITDFALLRKYGGDDFAGRADNFATQFMTDGFVGVLNAQGPVWKEQRRFSLHVLRDLGFGKNEMEPKIHAQIRKLVKHLEELTAESEDGAISVAYPIELAVGNVLSSVIFGTSYGREDPDFAEMRALNDEVMNLYTGPRIFLLLIYPWLRFIPVPGRFGFTAMLSVKKRFWSFFDRLLDDCKARFDPLAPVTDFTAAYLRELHLRRKAGEDMGFFSEQRLVAIMADFAIAGMDTTRATMEWAVLFLLHHPEVQAKVQMEMDIYFATLHRPVSMTDRQSLPYTAATLMEVQRLTNVLPINLQHSTMRDCEVEGFRLKAGTPILAQISVVLTDERYFPDPYRFDPLRFLDENGNKLKKVDEWVPFGMGKRQCGGESLARMNLFLVFASLLRQFHFAPIPGEDLPTLTPRLKYTRSSQSFRCLVTKRPTQ